jgi:hypothetical protein
MARKERERQSNTEKSAKPSAPEVILSMPQGTRQIVTVNGPADTPTIYVNNAQIEASNWDLRIRLGQIQAVSPTEIQVRDLVTVFMSHEHAKVFTKALSDVVSRLDLVKEKGTQG